MKYKHIDQVAMFTLKNVLSLKKTITQLYPCGILKVQSPDYIIQYASPEIFYKMAILTPK